MTNPETSTPHETMVGNAEAAAERSAELTKSAEKSAEPKGERQNRVESAREATREALAKKDRPAGEKKTAVSSVPTKSKASAKQKNTTYRATLSNIQSDMGPVSRTFSKVLHTPVVESTSTVLSSTVARPKSIIAGSFVSLVVVSILYLISKHYGYSLSGFETIGAFAVGWGLCLIYEAIRSLFERKPN